MSSEESSSQASQATDIISMLTEWCTVAGEDLETIGEAVVRGASDAERRLLTALGGVAKALVDLGNVDTTRWPNDVVAWMQKGPTMEPSIARAVSAQIVDGRDVLGSVYEQIVSGKNRRKLGTFFTPSNVMSYINDLVATHEIPAVTVADPGAGVGAFSGSALSLWPNATVYAVDINLVTLGLLAASPTSTARPNSDKLELKQMDFLDWLADEWSLLPGPKIIFGNPPYTRHQLLTREQKVRAATASGDLVPSGRSGLSTYFLAASLNALRSEDGLCMLLPVNWLEADYARSVRRFLWAESKRPTEIHLFPDEEHVFPGAQVAAMVLYVGPQHATDRPIRIFDATRQTSGAFKRTLTSSHSRASQEPATLMPSGIKALQRPVAASEGFVELGEVATVRRGVATGRNTFFLLTSEQVSMLPRGTYVPALARLREIEARELDSELHTQLQKRGDRCWLLSVTENDRGTYSAIDQLLKCGEEDSVHEAYLCKVRPVWYELEKVPAPHIIISPMSKETFRVIVNQIGAIPTNTLYGIRLKLAIDSPENRQTLADWLRGNDGQAALTNIARKHGDGLLKLEPRSLLRVQVPRSIFKESNSQETDRSTFDQLPAF